MNDVRVFVSYDPEHDRGLFELILAQSRMESSGFLIVDSSDRATEDSLCSEKTSRSIRGANQVIVICGEHSESSASMTAELRTAQEQGKPYFLLWGRREIMCTKPVGAKSSEGMYSWTIPILRDQIDLMARSAKWKTPTDEFKIAIKGNRSPDELPTT